MAFAQPKRTQSAKPKTAPAAQLKHMPVSDQLKEFLKVTAQANVSFVFPHGFREIKAPDDEDFSFDYAMELPGRAFEIWLQVRSEKENWFSYEHPQSKPATPMANPDSAYLNEGSALAISFAGEKPRFVRTIPPDVLTRYNADAGRSYLLTLLDLPETKRYKYALLITLQKRHTGYILAVCFTNDKGPEFFKQMDKASHCLKFKAEKP